MMNGVTKIILSFVNHYLSTNTLKLLYNNIKTLKLFNKNKNEYYNKILKDKKQVESFS